MESKVGFCKYCNQQVIVEAQGGATPEEINELASEVCNCTGARKNREKAIQKEMCLENIKGILEERYPEIAELFKNSIDAIQGGKIKKVTINTRFNHTARMTKTKDGIKVELEKKTKAESLA